MSDGPGPLIASGRAADVFDLGDGTVLRRYRTDHDSGLEARMMGWVHAQGLPVPRVHSTEGPDLVMDRVDGITMLEDLEARPWRLLGHVRVLADLQRRVNALTAPDWFPHHEGVPAGTSVLHLDFHPMNVMLGADGPIIIDWTNASRGPERIDAAMTYALAGAFEVTGLRDRVGLRLMINRFANARGRELVDSGFVEAARLRLADANTTTGERSWLEKELERRG